MIVAITTILFIAGVLFWSTGVHWFFLAGAFIGFIICICIICRKSSAANKNDEYTDSDGIKYYGSAPWCPSFGNICDTEAIKITADSGGEEKNVYEYDTPSNICRLDEWSVLQKYYTFLSDRGFWYNPNATDKIAVFHKGKNAIGIRLNSERKVLQIYPYIGEIYIDENGKAVKN